MTRRITPGSHPIHPQAHSLELVNFSVRLYQVQKDLIERASKKMGHETPSDYIRDTLTYQAALDLGEELPVVPEITRGRGGSIVSQAAAKLGMTVLDFERSAARVMAAQTLGANAIDDRPSSRPAPQPRTPSGTYARRDVTPEHVTARRSR